ncbi:solute carrier family 22 member 18 isoform X2 [Balaenoptera acutorostrata]|uniref:Solute carrier family 22 member 18 isoform X2 n=1 Tax=Balaenoptera acutorostrata TaxID=9767 RepID=A0ABM3U0V5_BALAC|nr:solute carrier family 22 member 18 isoform X2 [Balaenoptera acutorostrata]
MREVRASRGQGQSPSGIGTLDLSWVMLLMYVLAALELACLFMQFSIMPYLSRRLGLDSVAFGYQQTIFGVLQLLGGPVFGRFADQRGARAAFTLSFLASSALYLLLAAACSPALPGVALLFASRLPGALMHTLPAAQMVITDLSAPEERPAALSRLGLCFGVGVIFGSLLGGTLSSTCGIQCPVIVALVVNLLGAILSFTCIPTSTKGASARAQASLPGKPKASLLDLKAITCLLLQPGVLPVFLVKVICGFPSGLFMVMFSLISMDFFQLEAAQAGYLMSFFGLLQMRRCRPARPPFGCSIHTLASGLSSSPCSRLPRLGLSAHLSARRSRLRGERGDSSAVEAGEPLASHWETRRRPMVRRVSVWAPAVDRSGRGADPSGGAHYKENGRALRPTRLPTGRVTMAGTGGDVQPPPGTSA